jgi:hypothetical protein
VSILLSTGKVLICGGATAIGSGAGSLKTCDLFNPATNTVTITASMTYDRYQPNTFSIPNGLVMICGGYSATNLDVVAQCEQYSSTSQTFSLGPSMVEGRDKPSVTVLANGNVLLCGGNAASLATYITACELYLMASNSFVSAAARPSLLAGRIYHRANLLPPNGKVLVCGGHQGSATALSSCELYNNVTNSFSAGPSLTIGRSFHVSQPTLHGNMVMCGGINLKGCDLYTSAANTMSPIPSTQLTLSVNRAQAAVVQLPEGSVLVFGGASTSSYLGSDGGGPAILSGTSTADRTSELLVLN